MDTLTQYREVTEKVREYIVQEKGMYNPYSQEVKDMHPEFIALTLMITELLNEVKALREDIKTNNNTVEKEKTVKKK